MEVVGRIKQVAFERYKKYGFRSITLDDIAQELGISKKTIYTYFKDKDALVDAIMVEELERDAQYCLADKENAQNAVHELFLALQMMQKTMGDMNANFLYELKKYHYTSYQKFEQFKNGFLNNIIKENLQRGIQEELYRPDINPDIITAMRLETMSMVFNENFATNNKYNIIEIEEQLMEHFLYGIVTAKGHKLVLKYKAHFITKQLQK